MRKGGKIPPVLKEFKKEDDLNGLDPSARVLDPR